MKKAYRNINIEKKLGLKTNIERQVVIKKFVLEMKI